jgi:rubrerythrin
MTEDTPAAGEAKSLEPGTVVYDHDGKELGVITGMTAEGFEVSIRAEIEDVDEEGRAEIGHPETEGEQAAKTNEGSHRTSQQEQKPGKEFGEGYLMWRCGECGEMGELEDGMPEECPGCGAPKNDIYAWEED